MMIVGANVHFQKLEAKCSSPAFYQSYLEMIAAQELTEFLHMEIRSKYEDEVLEFYKNGKVKTIQSKKNPQRTIQVIKSTVGGAKVKISQKKLEKKLHLPNSGSEIGRLPAKNLDWKTIGISGQIPSSLAKKADLKNDYKLVLELVIACLECGSGGYADDITQERAFIINALITRTKVNWAKHFFNSASKHLGKPKQKYLCQGLYLGYILESLGVASKGKKYVSRYSLYYLSSKGENRVSSTAEESFSDNVLIMNLKKSSKRKHVVSPSPSAKAPQNLALVNLDDEEEVPAHDELQNKKKRKISSSSTSGSTNPDELVEKEPVKEPSAQNQSPQQMDEETHQDQRFPTPSSQAQNDDEVSKFMQVYYDGRAWKVGNSAEQLLEWEQQLKNEKMIKRCLGLPINYCCEQMLDAEWVWQKTYSNLHLEYLPTSPVSEIEADDDDTAVYKPENAASPQQEQFQTRSEEELQQLLQSHVQEILTTPCEISNQTGLEIPEKSTEDLEKSTPPKTNEAQQDPAVEIQRSFAETEGEAQIATMEATETPVAIFEQHIEDEDRDSLSRDISNFVNDETEEESENTLKIDEEEAEQGDAESLPLQIFHRVPSSHQKKTLEIISLLSKFVSNTMEAYASDCHFQFKEINAIKQQIATVTVNLKKQMFFLQMDIRLALAVSSANQVVTQDYLKVLAENQKEAFKLFRHFGTYTGKHKLDQSNQENSIQHLSNTALDGTEVVGTIASHFTYDAQTKERYNNLRRIKEECGIMQGIGETAGSSKRKKQ
ncbi:unnamed protein product [Cuscuta campestris]|uniref:Uncharacterized protein n=1 Tax=Cuscuta campestris TaxID=132261 RepID=A0A484NKI1_9ASTE|nr:unnamed protein product [Cuscuta campestris]